jgi:uncharacterized membrane protein YdjX (TVP38/TMEM64 family)
MINKKLLVFIIILSIIILTISIIGIDFVSFINSNLVFIISFVDSYPLQSKIIYFFSYIIMTSISLPVAGLLGLLSGMIFNLFDAIILVSFASSIGAVLSFWLSRYLFRNYFKHKYSKYYNIINNGFITNGAAYLFAIRMCMLFPYFIMNPLVGLTTIKTWVYYSVTQIGMFPSTVIIIMLGGKLNEYITSGITIDKEIIFLLLLLGLIPLLSKYIFKKYIIIPKD